MGPTRRSIQLLDDDTENDEPLLNHSQEEKREVRNKIEELAERLETYRKVEVKDLYNDDGFKSLLEDSKKMIQNIQNPQEFLDELKLYKKLCRLVQEMSSDVDGNKQKFTTQMYLTALAGNMTLDKLEQPDKTTERYKMNRNSIIEFGRRYGSAFNYAPTFKFVLGTLNNESVGATPRKRVVKRPAAQKAKERGTTKIANIGKNQTVEALTDRYVKLTRKSLEDNYAKNGKKALCYFSFVIDPDSFGKTVENMFHVSFLIKQRVATLAIGKNGMPTIEPFYGDDSDSDNETEGDSIGSSIDQAVIDICQADWEELKNNLNITKKMIEIPSA